MAKIAAHKVSYKDPFLMKAPTLSVCSDLPGYCLLQPGYYVVRAGLALGSAVGSAVRSVAQRLLSVLWLVLGAPG